MSSANTTEVSLTNNHETASTDHPVTQDRMEVEHVNKKPIKRVVPEKIAEVGQWKVAKEEDNAIDEATHKDDETVNKRDKAANEGDQAAHKDDKAVGEDRKAEISTEGAKTN